MPYQTRCIQFNNLVLWYPQKVWDLLDLVCVLGLLPVAVAVKVLWKTNDLI